MDKYRQCDNRITYKCHYHVVWCSTFRRPVLTEPMIVRIKELIKKVCDEKNIQLFQLDVTSNTVYLNINIPPTESVNNAVRHMKRVTAHVLRDEFPSLRSRLPSLWTLHYFISTAEEYPKEEIDKWITMQPRFAPKKRKDIKE